MDPENPIQERALSIVPTARAEIEKIKLNLAKTSDITSAKVLKKKQVLEEDDYTNRIETIIERDFFPDVTKLRIELEYQDALAKNDYEKLQELGKLKFAELNRGSSTICDTPLAFETPLNLRKTDNIQMNSKSDESERPLCEPKTEVKDKNMSLNAFLNKYTSEDNISFEQLQEEAKRKHSEKLEFLSYDSKTHNDKIENSLILPSVEMQVLDKAGLTSATNESGDRLLSWKYFNTNTVMFDPEGAPLTKQEMENLKSKQIIMHENTRLKGNPFNSHSVHPNAPAQNIIKHGKFGIDGKQADASGTPSVNGFKFVPSTPSLAPENLPGSPLMTWGEIDATPLSIRGDMTPLIGTNLTASSSHFHIPEVSQREKVGEELANRILSRNKRDVSGNTIDAIKNGKYKSSIERLDSMSPAARLLATKKLGLYNLDRSLQASYSPMMSSFRSQTPTPRQIITPSPMQPKFTPGTSKKTSQSSLDKRANQPQHHTTVKRAKASEFF